MGERIVALESWQSNHEEACATRWGLLLKVIGWGGSLAFVTVLSVAGFGLKSIYDGQQKQLDSLRALSVQVAQAPAAPATAVTVNPPPVPTTAPTSR
jgi:hypothetical protein